MTPDVDPCDGESSTQEKPLQEQLQRGRSEQQPQQESCDEQSGQLQNAADADESVEPDGEVSPSDENAVSEENVSVSCADGATAAQQPTKRKFASRLIDIFLWVLVAVLTVAVCLRFFVFGRITVVGKSMTAQYYSSEGLSTFDSALTYHDGDVVHVNKLAKPKRGDVAVFYKQSVNGFWAAFASNDDETYKKLIKRVVALGGDQLSLEPVDETHYRLVIVTPDGETLHEDYYTKEGTVLSPDAFLISSNDDLGLGCLKNAVQGSPDFVPYTVAENCFFALGDNRAHSDDSRGKLGDVPLGQLYGVVI